MTTQQKNNSALKKLIPATSMLLVSSVMLASSTYAWFTMSKEVSITGIKMTASVPEDIQLSLGHGMNSGSGLKTTTDGSTLATFAEAEGVRTLTLGAPAVTGGSTDWSNTVAVSDYYYFGRLTPATSKDGTNIYYTRDSVSAGMALPEDSTNTNTTSTNFLDNAFATFSAATNTNGMRVWMEPKASPSAEASSTVTSKDKTGYAYYVDIPVWFRTSISGTNGQTVGLAVTANFTASDNDGTPDIFKAARVAFLDPSNSDASEGAIMASDTKYYHRLKNANEAELVSGGVAPASGVTVTGANTSAKATWETVDPVTQATVSAAGYATAGDKVVAVPVSTTDGEYGNIKAYTMRVWIEGEDVNCWDETAAQDFQIDLKLTRYETLTNAS